MSSSNANPPIFPDTEKFNGANFATWEPLIIIAATSRGVLGYLKGTIPNPALPTSPTAALTYTPGPLELPLPDDSTQWYSTNPSVAEWAMHNAWVHTLLLYNTKNPIGLGLKLNGTAAEAWNSLTSQYKITSDLTAITTQHDLCTTIFSDGNDFPSHVSNLQTKWAIANSAGAKIGDADFHMIILSSLPASWDSVVGTLYDAKSSVEVINRLMIHWNRIDQSKSVNNPSSVVTALQTNVRQGWSQLQCTNQNCGHRGHTIINCYWKGGGKEGQFPPDFGRRRGACGSAPHTVTAALTDTSSTSEITLVLIVDVNSDDHLMTKDTALQSDGGDVLDIHSPDEVLLVSKDCILTSYPEGTWRIPCT